MVRVVSSESCERPSPLLISCFADTETSSSPCRWFSCWRPPSVDILWLLKQQRTGAGLDRLNCRGGKILPRIAPLATGTGKGDATASKRETTRKRLNNVTKSCHHSAKAIDALQILHQPIPGGLSFGRRPMADKRMARVAIKRLGLEELRCDAATRHKQTIIGPTTQS